MGELSYTTGGDSNLVSFRSAARVPITSLKASFLPKQDLHGYAAPYIGGGSKNMFNINVPFQNPDDTTVTNTTLRNFTPNTYHVGSSWSNWWQPNQILEYSISNDTLFIKNNNVYGVGFVFALTAGTNYGLSATSNNGGATVTFYDSTGATINESSTSILNSTFLVPNGCTITVITFYTKNVGSEGDGTTFSNIQLEKGTSITSYTPWENICPIEGWNETNIYTNTSDYKINYITGTTTSYSVTFTVNNNGYVTASGTPTSYSSRAYGEIDVEGTETIYGTIFGSLNNITWNKPTLFDINGEVISTTLSDAVLTHGLDLSQFPNVKRVRVYLKRINNNIPMSGWCAAVIGKNRKITPKTIPITFPVLGKNKFNWNVEQSHASPIVSDYKTARIFTLNTYVIGLSSSNYYRDDYTNWVLNPLVSNGTISFESNNASGYGIGFPLSLIAEQTYFLSGTQTGNGSVAAVYYDKDGIVISSQTYRLNKTITIPKNTITTVIVFYAGAPHSSYTFSDIQLELGDTATTYEPYNSENTVYGGYIDIAKGEVVQTWKVVDLGDYNWSYSPNTSPAYFSYQFSDRKLGAFNLYCSSLFLSDKTSPNNLKDHSFIGSTINGFVFIRNDSITSATDFISSITGVKLAYELNEPIHYPLSKIQLQTLLDQNNIWSNTNGNTEVSYAIHDSAMIRAAKQQILAAAQPQLLTSSGLFQTNFPASLQSAKIYFNPIQEGSGDPSPENVRPITGWTGLSVYHSGENLYIPNAENQGYINKSGVINVDTTSTYTDLIPVNPGEIYSFRCTTVSVNGDTNRRIHGYDSNGEWVQQIVSGTTAPNTVEDRKILATIPSGITYIRVSFRNQDTNVRIAKENVYEIDWENEVGTVYGGYVDLVSGEVYSKYHKLDLANLSWYNYSGHQSHYTYITRPENGLFFCNMLTPKINTIWPGQTGIGYYTQSKYRNNIFVYKGEAVANDAEFRTWFAETYPDAYIVYESETQLITTLTPQTLKALRSQNNIWSNANGPIEVKYWTH